MAYGAAFESVQKSRLNLIGGFFVVVLLLIASKLVQHQIIEYPKLSAMARDQHMASENMPAERGKILVYDPQLKDYYPMATNVSLFSLNVVPTQVQRPELVAAKLLPFLPGMEESQLLTIMKSGKVYVAPLRRRIEDTEANQIRELNLDGVYLRSEKYRYYPEDTLAAQVLGFVNRDGVGQYGVEGYLNKELSGQQGTAQIEKASTGSQIAIGNSKIVKPQDGADVVLTIDRAVQYYVEKKLKEAVTKHGSTGGEVIIMEPSTGKVIAMASYPNFNPNFYNESKVEQFSNPNTSAVYEPGSAFKVITMAAGIDAGVITPSTTYTDTGEAKVADRVIKNSDKKAHGVQSMTEVLTQSLNTGTVYVIQKLGKLLFYKYLKDLGFDSATGVELDGETPAHIRPYGKWGEVDLATMSFGQGIAITTMQLVTAVGAIANQGILMKPHIVDKIVYPSGAVSVDPQVVRQAIKPQTAQLVAAMMVNVVKAGHGKRAGVVGYTIAGKTGTAQIPNSKGGGYEAKDTIGTFVGFGPVDNPRFVMLTRIDRPQDVTFAESSAAPLFGDIAKFLLDYWQVPPDKTN